MLGNQTHRPKIHENLFDAPNMFDVKTKACNGQFFQIYEFLTCELPDTHQTRIAKEQLKDAFEQYRLAISHSKKGYVNIHDLKQVGR